VKKSEKSEYIGEKGEKGEEEEQHCAICMSNIPDTALIECGHLYCSDCANPLIGKECPLCRRIVLRFLKIFRS